MNLHVLGQRWMSAAITSTPLASLFMFSIFRKLDSNFTARVAAVELTALLVDVLFFSGHSCFIAAISRMWPKWTGLDMKFIFIWRTPPSASATHPVTALYRFRFVNNTCQWHIVHLASMQVLILFCAKKGFMTPMTIVLVADTPQLQTLECVSLSLSGRFG